MRELGYHIMPLRDGIARVVAQAARRRQRAAIGGARRVTGFSETRRQTLHMAMASFALLLRVLTWWQAALCAVAAFLFNLFVLPRIGGASLNRPGDARARLPARHPVLSAVGPRC